MATTYLKTNTLITSQAILAFRWLGTLFGAGWKGKEWSDGLGGGHHARGSGPNAGNWNANPFGGSGSGAGNLGNQHAYIVMVDPIGIREILFSNESATSSTWFIYYSALNTFVLAAGTDTTPPTAADQKTPWKDTGIAQSKPLTGGAPDGSYRSYGAADSTGWFWFNVIQHGVGPVGAFALDVPQAPVGGDSDCAVIYFETQQNQSGYPPAPMGGPWSPFGIHAEGPHGSSGPSSFCWFDYGGPNAAFVGVDLAQFSVPNGDTLVSEVFFPGASPPLIQGGNFANFYEAIQESLLVSNCGPNLSDGNDELLLTAWVRLRGFKAPPYGLKMYSQIFLSLGTSKPTGKIVDTGSAKYFVTGTFAMPWDPTEVAVSYPV